MYVCKSDAFACTWEIAPTIWTCIIFTCCPIFQVWLARSFSSTPNTFGGATARVVIGVSAHEKFLYVFHKTILRLFVTHSIWALQARLKSTLFSIGRRIHFFISGVNYSIWKSRSFLRSLPFFFTFILLWRWLIFLQTFSAFACIYPYLYRISLVFRNTARNRDVWYFQYVYL